MSRTERLWLTEPRRKTALAKVTEVRGDRFRLDRSLYCPKSRQYRHPQPADQGTVWTPDGEKRRLVSAFEDDGLWHRLRGAVPAVGDTLQCHLDVARRELAARAHTAMHLAIHTLPRGCGSFSADPEVRGGGHVRFSFDAAWIAPNLLADWRRTLLQHVGSDIPVERTHVVDTAVAHRLTAQPFPDTRFPGPPTTREAVTIGALGALPCDGTHVGRTGAIGDVVVREAHPDRSGGFVVVLQVR